MPSTRQQIESIRPAWSRLSEFANRAFLVAVLILGGVTTVRCLAGRRYSPVAPSRPATLAPQVVAPGRWIIAGLAWELNVSEFEPAAGQLNWLAGFADNLAAPSTDSSAEEQQIVALLDSMATSRRIEPGRTLLELDLEATRLVALIGTESDQPRLLAAACAYPAAGDRWTVIAGRPIATSSAAAESLLPLPAGTERIAGRYSPVGRLQSEVVHLPPQSAELIEIWRRAGWRVEAKADAGQTSTQLLCARGERLVQACLPPAGEAAGVLILVDVTATNLESKALP